jgi:hypothetical protein
LNPEDFLPTGKVLSKFILRLSISENIICGTPAEPLLFQYGTRSFAAMEEPDLLVGDASGRCT